ncbi:hypothetical protein JKP88DRAFT_289709 [Tribonema minus]|uniref:EF-hand domain-containing protein n=1 Tax=Tribonema minus TaxID=303371 RepID=A0A836CFN6_9STRA|nr:hypothetical protein JKP88DRAFT_289709 [Tribonema minus]
MESLTQPHPLQDTEDFTRQFDVPAALPGILRAFAKAAIKEQPEDINSWAYAYFRDLHDAGEDASIATGDVHGAGAGESTGAESAADSLATPLGMRVTTREANVSGAMPLQAEGLTNEALVDRISLLFTEADTDGNGSLSRREFQEIFNLLAEELELSDSDVLHILAEADENDNGVVEYKEFVPVAVDLVMALLAKESYASTARTRRSSAKEEAKDFLLKGLPKGELEASIREGLPKEELEASIREVFRGVDVDGNGTLDRAEFLKCLRDSGLGFTRRELNLMMTVVDRNNDGVIDYEEFVPVAFNMLLDMVARQLQLREETALCDHDVPREEAALCDHVRAVLRADEQQRISHTDAIQCIMGANLGLPLVQVHAAMSECKEDPSEGTFNCEELAEAVAGMVMAISELRGNDEGYKKAYVVTQEIEGMDSSAFTEKLRTVEIEGMDSGAFTEKLRTVIQGVAGGGASANGGRLSVALVAASKDDVRDAIRAGFPGLNAQQLQDGVRDAIRAGFPGLNAQQLQQLAALMLRERAGRNSQNGVQWWFERAHPVALCAPHIQHIMRDLTQHYTHALPFKKRSALVLLTEPAKGGGWSCDKVVTWGFKTMQGLARTSYLKRQAAARGGGGGGESDSGSVPGSQDKSLSLEENDE